MNDRAVWGASCSSAPNDLDRIIDIELSQFKLGDAILENAHIIAFNIALIAAIASPGPALLVAIKTTLSSGRTSGIAVGAGLGLVASLWTLAALFGLEIVFSLFPLAYVVVKTLGAAYLIFIAYGMWTGATDQINSEAKPGKHAFRQGVLINIMNPKSVLFSAAVLVVIFPADMSAWNSLFVVTNHLIVELALYTALAFGMSTATVSERYLRAKVFIDRFAAGVLGLLGLRLLSDLQTD